MAVKLGAFIILCVIVPMIAVLWEATLLDHACQVLQAHHLTSEGC